MANDKPRPALTRKPRSADAVDALAARQTAPEPPSGPPAAPEPPKPSPVAPRGRDRVILVQVSTRISLDVDDAMTQAVAAGEWPSKQALIEAALRAQLGL